jgi:hypothetical protein
MQAGESVDNPKAWKAHQVSANMVAAFLFALVQLAKAFGYDFGIDMQTCADIAIGVLALVNVGLTVATTKHIGLPAGAVREAESSVPSVEQPAEEKPAEVSPVSDSEVRQSSIDDDTRQRAIAWAREHSKPIVSVDNGLHSDA